MYELHKRLKTDFEKVR